MLVFFDEGSFQRTLPQLRECLLYLRYTRWVGNVDYIPREECKEGYTYKIHSRNLRIGVYQKGTNPPDGFTGIREKFGDLFLFTEYHCDGEAYATVRPESEIEKCPLEDLREHFDTICFKCREAVDFVKSGKYGPETGDWEHVGDPPDGCQKVVTSNGNWGSPPNKALFDYLNQLERKLFGKPLCWRCQEGQHGRHRDFSIPMGRCCECDDPACTKTPGATTA